MTLEDQHTDLKSLRTITGKSADWEALAKDCVCFTNSAGGRLEDLARYPNSSSTEINQRIGAEISAKTVKRALDDLGDEGRVTHEGERRWRRYRLSGQEHKGQRVGK